MLAWRMHEFDWAKSLPICSFLRVQMGGLLAQQGLTAGHLKPLLVCTPFTSLLACLIQRTFNRVFAVCEEGHSRNKNSKVPEQLCHCSSSLVSANKSLLCHCYVAHIAGAITRRDRQAGRTYQAVEPQVVRGHAEQWV